MQNNFEKVIDMMPKKTIEVLKREIQDGGIIYGIRDEEAILDTANEYSFEKRSITSRRKVLRISKTRCSIERELHTLFAAATSGAIPSFS